jgi:3-oxoadipate enol-lactonase
MGAVTNPQTGYVESEGARLYYETAGTGIPLVMLHAGIADRRMWDEEFQTFAAHYRAIRYDMAGYGKSTRGTGEASPVADLEALLAALNISQAVVIGCSVGGSVALDFTRAHPALVSALVLVGAVPSGYNLAGTIPPKIPAFVGALQQRDLAGAAEWAAQLWYDGPNREPDQMDPAQRAWVRDMMRDVLATGAVTLGPAKPAGKPAIERLAEIAAPTLVIVGDQDDPSILAAGEALAAGIPGAQKAVIAGAAHLPNIEKPAEFDQLVTDFLARKLDPR